MEDRPPLPPEVWIRRMFEASLQALAQSAEVQLSLYPDQCAKADELAINFDNHWITYRPHFGELLTQEQLKAVEAIDQLLSQMSGPRNADLWTEEAMRTHPTWDEVRSLATAAIVALDLPRNAPAKHWFQQDCDCPLCTRQ